MTNEYFEQVVRDTIKKLPREFRLQLDNVQIVIEDWPGDTVPAYTQGLLLGLYQGVPKTKRFAYANLPDKITLFKEAILHMAHDETDAKRIIRDTVLHELGHHFGLSDEELRRVRK